MSGDNCRPQFGHSQCLLCSSDHAVDVAESTRINEWVAAVEKGIAQVQHISLLKMNVNVGVCVSGWKVSKRHFLLVREELESIFENHLRQCVGWGRREMHSHGGDFLRRGQTFAGVLM